MMCFLRSYDDDVEEKVFLISCTSIAEMRTDELTRALEGVCWKEFAGRSLPESCVLIPYTTIADTMVKEQPRSVVEADC
jgi:hypothetical protein